MRGGGRSVITFRPHREFAGVRSFSSSQRGQAELSIQRHPTLSGAERDSRCRRDRLQRPIIFEVKLEQVESIKDALSGLSRTPRQFVLLEEYAK